MKQPFFFLIAFALIIGNENYAHAFWSGDNRLNQSGLDVSSGYDVNTVTTLHGTVITAPAKVDQSEYTQMTISTGKETTTILLGPWSYWEKQAFSVSRDQDITVTGSRAQGKDGSIYLFAQSLDNKTSGASVSLRSETGSPFWAHGNGNGGGQRHGRRTGNAMGNRGSMSGGGRR